MVQIMLRNLEMPLINREVNLILKWYKECVISSIALEAQATKVEMT